MTNISLSNAHGRTTAFRGTYPNVVKAIEVSPSDLTGIIAQTGCVGFRFYFCLEVPSDATTLNLVVVGVDASGNDLYNGVLKNSGITCPPDCSTANPLNS